jgi:hypothetical protein
MVAVVATRRFGLLGVVICALLILILSLLMIGLYLFVSDRVNPFSLKSLFNRMFLLLRAYEVGNYFMPFGAGPGAQSRAIYTSFVPTTLPLVDFGFLSEVWPKSIATEKAQIYVKIKKGFLASPHNTYIEYFISMGVLGVVFAISLFLSQLKCVVMAVYERLDAVPILSVNVALMIMFFCGSFSHYLWLFILFQRMSCLHYFVKGDESKPGA